MVGLRSALQKFVIQAALAQSVARVLGKDEVGGSSPLGSSGKGENKGFSRYEASESLYFITGKSERMTYYFSIRFWTCETVCNMEFVRVLLALCKTGYNPQKAYESAIYIYMWLSPPESGQIPF